MFRRKQRPEEISVPSIVTGQPKAGHKIAKPSSRAIAALLIVLVLVLAAAVAYITVWSANNKHIPADNSGMSKTERELEEVNKSIQSNDTDRALEHARKALKSAPQNLTAIETVASLVRDKDPGEAKQLYGRAFEAYKKQYGLDEGEGTVVTYWAAATLAKDAGKASEAKRYFQKVIDTADLSDRYHQSLVAQSKAALGKL